MRIGLGAALACCLLSGLPAAAYGHDPGGGQLPPRAGLGTLPRVAASGGWLGGASLRQAPAGGRAQAAQAPAVRLSASLPQDAAARRAWVDFLTGLVHGPELARLQVYVAPPAEVRQACREQRAAACYIGSQALMVVPPMTQPAEIDPRELAAHEYGHHVAANRSNHPWAAFDHGTKRWSSYENVCRRSAEGTAFPGDQGENYDLNPGEAFAEAYRLLNGGSPNLFRSNTSFYPDGRALELVRRDVLEPWRPTIRRYTGRLGARRRALVMRIATPYDGVLAVSLRGRASMTLWRGSRAVARGRHGLTYLVCGQERFRLRTRGVGPIALNVSKP